MLRIEFPQGREQGNSRDNIRKVGGGGMEIIIKIYFQFWRGSEKTFGIC